MDDTAAAPEALLSRSHATRTVAVAETVPYACTDVNVNTAVVLTATTGTATSAANIADSPLRTRDTHVGKGRNVVE